MTTATRSARSGDRPPKDCGCQFAPKCATCPWRTCVKELSESERGAFIVAWRTLRRHLAAPAEREGGTR